MEDPNAVNIPVFETIQIDGVVRMEAGDLPDGGKVISYILPNGRKYTIPASRPATFADSAGSEPRGHC